jgi:hypothetical protein
LTPDFTLLPLSFGTSARPQLPHQATPFSRWLPDPLCGELSRLEQAPLESHPRLGDWVVKLKDTGLNEVAGYQFAEQLGVPVSGYRPFVLERALPRHPYRLAKGEVALMIERLAPTGGESEISLAETDPELAMRILAFWTFDHHEWGEIWRVGERLVVIDLEFLLARYVMGRTNRRGRFEEYAEMTTAVLKYALDVARKAGQEERYRAALRAVCGQAVAGGIAFDFHPHRWGKSVEDFLVRSLQTRAKILLGTL